MREAYGEAGLLLGRTDASVLANRSWRGCRYVGSIPHRAVGGQGVGKLVSLRHTHRKPRGMLPDRSRYARRAFDLPRADDASIDVDDRFLGGDDHVFQLQIRNNQAPSGTRMGHGVAHLPTNPTPVFSAAHPSPTPSSP